MNGEEYLRELRTGLEGRMPPAEAEDILSEYAGFFDAGRQEGRTEEAVAASLGSPAGLVRMLTGERGPVPPAPPAPPLFAAAAPAAVSPPLASFGRRVGALLIDRLAVFLLLALLLTAVMLLTAGPAADSPASRIQAHTDGFTVVRVETGVVVSAVPLLLLLVMLVPQLGVPAMLLVLGTRIYSEACKPEPVLLTVAVLLGGLLAVLYKPVLECLWNGRTLGKRLMGIRVAAPDGGRAGAGRILVRELVGDLLLGGISGGITTLVSIFTASIGRERKSVPDYIASTLVVTDRKRR